MARVFLAETKHSVYGFAAGRFIGPGGEVRGGEEGLCESEVEMGGCGLVEGVGRGNENTTF